MVCNTKRTSPSPLWVLTMTNDWEHSDHFSEVKPGMKEQRKILKEMIQTCPLSTI